MRFQFVARLPAMVLLMLVARFVRLVHYSGMARSTSMVLSRNVARFSYMVRFSGVARFS